MTRATAPLTPGDFGELVAIVGAAKPALLQVVVGALLPLTMVAPAPAPSPAPGGAPSPRAAERRKIGRRAPRAAAPPCTTCEERPADAGYKTCGACRQKAASYSQKKRDLAKQKAAPHAPAPATQKPPGRAREGGTLPADSRVATSDGEDPEPAVALAYDEFKTGLTFGDVRGFLWSFSENRLNWPRVSRHTVLGRWRQIKREMFGEYERQLHEPPAPGDSGPDDVPF